MQVSLSVAHYNHDHKDNHDDGLNDYHDLLEGVVTIEVGVDHKACSQNIVGERDDDPDSSVSESVTLHSIESTLELFCLFKDGIR